MLWNGCRNLHRNRFRPIRNASKSSHVLKRAGKRNAITFRLIHSAVSRTDAATALVGQSIGAGRKPMAKRFAWITTLMGMGIMGFLAILMWIFAPEMMGIMSPDTAVIDLGARVLRIEAWAELGYAASLVIYGAFVGAADTKIPSFMNFGSMWLVRIIPAIFITRIYGLPGFWMCMAVELCFRGAIFIIRLASGAWLKGK